MNLCDTRMANKKSEELSRKLANSFTYESVDLLDEYKDVIMASEKELRNAKGHKNRLKELSSQQDFC